MESLTDQRVVARILLAAMLLGGTGRAAHAQSAGAMLADDLIVLSKGQRAKEQARTETPLGFTPGTPYNPFRFEPGETDSILGPPPSRFGAALPTQRRERDVLSAITETPPATPIFTRPSETAQVLTSPVAGPTFETLEISQEDDEGPADGMTLDMAIDRLLNENLDLRSKVFEIPQAQSDILSAGLRANPILFASADSVPYGSYSPRRPGSNDYTVTIVQPLDVSGKIRTRTQAATQARNVIEAQYQDAVRQEIASLGSAFVDVLAERETTRYAQASLVGRKRVLEKTEELFRRGVHPHSEVDRAAIQVEAAELGVEDAIKRLRQAKQALAYYLNIPDGEADSLRLRGRVREDRLTPPPVEELVRIAQTVRPDLAAFRLGVCVAQANVAVERAARFEDVFVLYTPSTYTNNAPINAGSTTSWSLGGVVSVPLFNRNQGNIERAKLNVGQAQVELARLERRIAAEVRRAWLEYDASRHAVLRIERDLLPRARHLRDDKFRLYSEGEENFITYANAQRDYDDAARQYRDTLIRHRRSMLQLNSAVGQRILP